MILICTILAAASHFHGPAHSPRYLLALLILSFPTLLITLLAFLVDILLFIPHMQWGGWIVLAATIIIMACSVITCAMRRTLVSRKARKKRIAENAEMSGENYYNSREEAQFGRVDSPPPLKEGQIMNGTPGGDKLPQFVSYPYERSRPSTDDRVPLNRPGPESLRTNSSNGPANPGNNSSQMGTPLIPLNIGAANGRGTNGDGQGSPVSPLENDGAPLVMHQYPSDTRNGFQGAPRGRGDYSSRGGPSPAPLYGRGRGGYPQRGGFPPRGGYPTRGGFPPRGGFGRDVAPGMMGAPPPGWNRGQRNMGVTAAGAGVGLAAGAMMGRERRGPPPGYQNGYSRPMGGRDHRSGPPVTYNDYPRDEVPYGTRPDGPSLMPDQPTNHGYGEEPARLPYTPLVGGAAYERTPSPDPPSAPAHGEMSFPVPISAPVFERETYGRDPASFGFSGRRPSPGGPRSRSRPRSRSPVPAIPVVPDNLSTGQALEMDGTAMPNRDAYDSEPRGKLGPFYNSPVELGNNTPRLPNATLPTALPPVSDPVELPGHEFSNTESDIPTSTNLINSTLSSNNTALTSSDAYYEDVPPRFLEPHPLPLPTQPPPTQPLPNPPSLPSSLIPGTGAAHLHPSQHPGVILRRDAHSSSSVYADRDRDRDQRRGSPAQSDGSNFTSVSQRGVNPQYLQGGGGGGGGGGSQFPQQSVGPSAWLGGGGGGGGGASSSVYSAGPRGAARQREQESLLSGNPDFSIPGMGGGRGGVGGGGRGVLGLGQGHARRGSLGMIGGSRYPGAGI